jgi:uncharacterized protein (TIGR04255 family)
VEHLEVPAPFGRETVREVPLVDPPLVQVIGQVQFPLEPAIAVPSTPAFLGFRQAIKSLYSVLEPRRGAGVLVTPEGYSPTPSNVVWEFERPETTWRVSLAPNFIAVYGPAYRYSKEYLTQLELVLEAVREHFSPAICKRIGLRHVNRLGAKLSFQKAAAYARPELRGFLTVPLPRSVALRYSLTETEFQLEGGAKIQARWGPVPPDTIVDPNIDPGAEPHFLLDIDVFSDQRDEFEVESILKKMREYTQLSYHFFRWSLTREALESFGVAEDDH